MSANNNEQKNKKKKKKSKKRTTYFCIGVCETWVTRNTWNNVIPIHAILKKLKDKHNLK